MRTKTFIIALLVLGALQVRAQVNNVSAFSQKLQEREQKKKDEVKASRIYWFNTRLWYLVW